MNSEKEHSGGVSAKQTLLPCSHSDSLKTHKNQEK